MSLLDAPALIAIAKPSPVATDGLVVLSHNWPHPPVAINTASADMLANFSRADGDKIKLFEVDGVTPIANPISGSTLGLMSDGFGGTAVYVVGSSGVLFNTNSPDVATLQDSDFTVA